MPPIVAKPRRLALLVYLTATSPRRFHSRDELIAMFWPEHDDAHGRAALRQAIHVLRRSLGERVVTPRGDTLGIEESRVWCDLCAFHQHWANGDAASVLRLYRGELLPGFHITAAPAFERWLDGERARVRRHAAQAAWTLASVAEQTGDWSRAAALAEAAIEAVPDDEVALRRLLSTYDRLGDRVRAVRTYDAFSARIASEYSVQPAPETQELIRSIRMRMRCREHAPPSTLADMSA